MNQANSLSTCSAITLMVSTMMGTGITFMPYAFNTMGYMGSWLVLVLVGICTFFSLLVLAQIAMTKDKKCTYTSIAKDVSYSMHYFVSVSIFFNCFFSNVSFYRFVTDIIITSFPVIRDLGRNAEWSRKLVSVIIAPLMLHLSCKKQLVNLQFIGYLSFISVVFLSLLTIFYACVLHKSVYNPIIKKFDTNYKLGLPFLVPSMVCEPSMIEVCQRIRSKSWNNIVCISAISSILGVLSYGLVGHCGYMIFGHTAKGHIIEYMADPDSSLNIYIRNNTIDRYNILSKLAVYSMVCLLVSGFPIQLVPVSEMFMVFLYKENKNDKRKDALIVLLFITCFVLVLVEHFRIKFIKRIIGAVFSTSVAFVFPFIYYFNMKSRSKVLTYTSVFIFSLSVIVVCYILLTIIIDVINVDEQLYN